MENFTFFTILVYLVVAILQTILFFKVWGMCNNIADMEKRFRAVCPTEEERRAAIMMPKPDKEYIIEGKADVNAKANIIVGDHVLYEPADRKMIVKEITADGRLVCISYKPDGSEEREGTYKPEQVVKYRYK